MRTNKASVLRVVLDASNVQILFYASNVDKNILSPIFNLDFVCSASLLVIVALGLPQIA